MDASVNIKVELQCGMTVEMDDSVAGLPFVMTVDAHILHPSNRSTSGHEKAPKTAPETPDRMKQPQCAIRGALWRLRGAGKAI